MVKLRKQFVLTKMPVGLYKEVLRIHFVDISSFQPPFRI